jgi:hypothetical protein
MREAHQRRIRWHMLVAYRKTESRQVPDDFTPRFEVSRYVSFLGTARTPLVETCSPAEPLSWYSASWFTCQTS